MIAKQIKGKDFYGVLSYNQKKVDKAEGSIVDSNIIMGSVVQQTKEFNIVRQLRPNLAKVVYHVSLNLPYEDANKLTDHEFADLGRDYLEGMGFNDNQYIIYKHFDQEHSHCHIVANRIKYSGDLVSDSQDYKRSEALVRKLEKKYNLTELIQKEEPNVLSKGEIEKCLRTGDVPDRLDLQNMVFQILNEKVTLEQFQKKLKQKGIELKLNQGANGTISGVSFEYKNIAYKGSKVHRSLSWSNINKKLNKNEQDRNNNAFSTIDVGDRENSKEANRIIRTTDNNWKNDSTKSEHDLGETQEDLSKKRRKKRKFRF